MQNSICIIIQSDAHNGIYVPNKTTEYFFNNTITQHTYGRYVLEYFCVWWLSKIYRGDVDTSSDSLKSIRNRAKDR